MRSPHRPIPFVLLCAVLGICLHANAQTTPVITTINPPSVTAGSSNFTLTVTGSGFVANSVVQVNGSARPTMFVSPLQLTATIFASDIGVPVSLQITVFNPFFTRPGVTSNTVTLTVTPAVPGPTLTSVSPEFAAQGTERIRMTLVGTNFRPGATVVISPPLSSVSNSNGRTRASDIQVVGVSILSSTLMTAIVTVGPTAKIGIRAVDVLNVDGTSTAGSPIAIGTGTSQPIRVESSTSLGAPLSVLNMALIHPRDGTVVMEGQELNAEAVLAGSGTGTVIGQWVWDGNVVEQFSASIVGGQSTTIRTRQSLPTSYLGVHTLQLRMIEPNQVATRPIVVVVNPGTWQLQQLIQPEYGAAFAIDNPPRFLWAPVPGAAKYQIGFSTKPYLSTIGTWFDLTDNQWEIPSQNWRDLPDGEIFWTVRAVETDGETRKPLPMRSIYRLPEGGLVSVRPVPSRTAAGNTLLEWKPAIRNGFYFVVISADAEGRNVIREYLTPAATLDLRAVDGKLTPGTTYFWQVNALAPNGNPVMSGPSQSFVAKAAPRSSLSDDSGLVRLASLGLPEALPGLPDLASEITSRTPPPNSNINDPEPTISATFPTPVNPADVSLMVDDIDITSMAQVTGAKVAFTPPLALAGGDHNVNLTVGNEATTWKFTEAAPALPTPPAVNAAATFQPGTDAEAPPSLLGTLPLPSAILSVPKPPGAGGKEVPRPPAKSGPSEEGQISANTQWASGSNPPDTNTISVAQRVMYEDGPWRVEVNGSGLLNSTLNPGAQRTSQGRVNDYVLELGYKTANWGTNLRFGTVSPVLYTDAQFVTAATPRQGAEVTLTTPAGTFGYFVNTNDEALGGGAGINFHQQLMGASWQAPLPKWAQFRLMWLSAQDIGAPTSVAFDSMGNPIITPNPVAAKSSGDVYGALLNIHVTPKWLWSSEYAFSEDNPNTNDPTLSFGFGRAWRTGISGQTGGTNMNVTYRDVSPNFGNPANPSLTQSSQSNLRGVDSAITQTTKSAGTFGLDYTFLENNVDQTDSAELLLHSFMESWSKPFGVKTNLVVDARQSLTQTGTIPAALQGLSPDQQGSQDQRDLSGDVNLTRQIGAVSLSVGGTRDWNRNNLFPSADTITSSLTFGTNLITRGFFQLNSQANANWVAADGLTVGTTRNITVYIQPAFSWKKSNLQLSPLITFTKGRTMLANGTLTSDTLTGQYGGRLSWTLPGVLKFSTFSLQGNYDQNRNDIMSMGQMAIDQRSTQLLVLWTATWGRRHAF